MAVTNFLVSNLPSYVEENRDLIIKNFALPTSGTRSRIGLREGVKSGVKIPFLDFTIALQDGSSCGHNPLDEAELAQATITVEALKHDGEVCPETLLGKYAEYLVRVNATENELPYEQYLMDAMTREINKVIENLIWQGDKVGGSGNMALMDGFLVAFGADNDVIDVSIASGASAYAGLMAVYAAMPDETLDRGGIIFAGSDIYRAFIMDLVNMNMFHYSGPQGAAPEEIYLPGTDVRIVKTYGLTGTKKVVATFADNLVYATDAAGDDTDVELWFSQDDRVFKWQVKWTSGVGYFFSDQVVLGEFAAAPVAITSAAASLQALAPLADLAGAYDSTNEAIQTITVTP